MKRIGDGKNGGGLWVSLASQNVDDHSGRKYALIKRLLASRFDCRKTVDTDTFQDRHHLSVPIMHAFKLPSNMLHGSWQNPIKEWCTVPQCSRFACQDRNIMPWIINCLATTEAAFMLAYLDTILPYDDAVGISMDLGWAANGSRQHRIFVVVETHEASFADRGLYRVEAIELAGIADQMGLLLFEHLPDRALRLIDMLMSPGVTDAFVQQPAVQLIVGFEAQPRREEAFTDKINLILDLTFLPARRRCTGHWFDKEMAAHLLKAAIVLTLFTDEDCFHCCLHIMGWTPPSEPSE